jgi:hypothetical protein
MLGRGICPHPGIIPKFSSSLVELVLQPPAKKKESHYTGGQVDDRDPLFRLLSPR